VDAFISVGLMPRAGVWFEVVTVRPVGGGRGDGGVEESHQFRGVAGQVDRRIIAQQYGGAFHRTLHDGRRHLRIHVTELPSPAGVVDDRRQGLEPLP
jgi:hypothetical protein